MRIGKWFLMAALLVALAAVANAQLTGAIWTSTSTGTTVNGNIYESKEDVYLNGGPLNCKGSGLPDGEYYFQVTDPSGATLLSTDDALNRMVTVSNGVIVSTSGSHDTGSSACTGAISVKLMPYEFTPNNGGEYKVWLISTAEECETTIDSKVIHFKSSCAKTDNFKVRERDGEPSRGTITGYKWYDTNTDGKWDSGEPPIEGWKIYNETDGIYACTYSDGKYEFLGLPSTEYTISEVLPTPPPIWLPTTATSGSVTTDEGGNGFGPDFGNVCLGSGGGKTLGFWSNKNGQKVFDGLSGPTAIEGLTALNLRDGAGDHFDPSSYTVFRTWIINATATNMAYMLSAQLAAMKLNVLAGFVDGNALIYAPGTTSVNAAGFATVNAIIAEADAELGLHGYTPAESDYRSYQEALKNALDKANNNMNFVQPGPCPLPAEGYCP